MNIRRAKSTDVGRVLDLLSQVLEIHAKIRPDVFVPDTTKYSAAELEEIFADPMSPVYVATDEGDRAIGYAFCKIKESAKSFLVPAKTVYIDDLCVDEAHRRSGIGEALFHRVCEEAASLGCSSVTLNVWAGNENALRFYEKMGMKPRSTQMEIDL